MRGVGTLAQRPDDLLVSIPGSFSGRVAPLAVTVGATEDHRLPDQRSLVWPDSMVEAKPDGRDSAVVGDRVLAPPGLGALVLLTIIEQFSPLVHRQRRAVRSEILAHYA